MEVSWEDEESTLGNNTTAKVWKYGLLAVKSHICKQSFTNIKGGQVPRGPSQNQDSLTGTKWAHRIRAHKTMGVPRGTPNQADCRQCTSCLCIHPALGCEQEGHIHHLNLPALAVLFMLVLLTRASNTTEIRRIRHHCSWSACKLTGVERMKAHLGMWCLRKKRAQYKHQQHLYLTVCRIGPWKAANVVVNACPDWETWLPSPCPIFLVTGLFKNERRIIFTLTDYRLLFGALLCQTNMNFLSMPLENVLLQYL